MKRLLCCLLAVLCLTVLHAQRRQKYEFRRNLPVYADSLLKDLTYPLAWGNSDITDFSEWRAAARSKVLECMLTPPAPPNLPERGGLPTDSYREHRSSYTVYKIYLPLSRYYTVPAYLLVPDGEGPFPAVNLLHDHGGHLFIGKEKMIRPLACEEDTVRADADAWVRKLYDGQFVGDYLAQHGYVVLSADAPLWGERGQEEGPRREKYDMIAGNMMMYGIDLSAYMTYDDLSATDWLASLPCVDKERIGCMGFSMGAYRAWMLAALSPHIKATVAICWMTTTDDQLSFRYQRTENGGFANCLPGLRRWLDYPHIASIACPNALLFINGRSDKLFHEAGVSKAFAQMRQVWHSQGADQQLQTELWDMGHECPQKAQQRALQFLKEHL